MLFCTELEKSKPSSVNFACFFFFAFFNHVFYRIVFYFHFDWVDTIFQKTFFDLCCCLWSLLYSFFSFFFCQSLKKKQREFHYLLFLFSFHLPLRFASLALFFCTFLNEKWFGIFSCYQIYLNVTYIVQKIRFLEKMTSK